VTASAPWSLTGEALACLVRTPPGAAKLPEGLARIPGPSLVVGVRYTGSPVGPYLELAVGEPARLGARPGWCITTMVVDSPESRLAGRMNWGFPKELGTLTWSADGDERRLHWLDGGLTMVGRANRAPLPFLVPVRSLQRRADGPVVVPGRLWGRAGLTRVEIALDAAGDRDWLAGAHPGASVAGMRFIVRPARHPFGWASSLRAPLRAPDPVVLIQPAEVA